VSRAELLVVGSIALDSLQGPYGQVEDELGGSAVYFSLAAGLIGPVRVVAPVGLDAAARVQGLLGGRPGVDGSGIQVVDAPTYRWRATSFLGSNLDLGSKDSIYDSWRPAVPTAYEGWAFVGSMRIDHQVDAARQLAGSELLASDAMRSYLEAGPQQARDLIGLCGWYFCNEQEFAALGGAADRPEEFRSNWALDGLLLKAGPRGVTAYTRAGALSVPALLSRPVVDTTGAGDALAGGTLARWLQSGAAPDGLRDALMHGVACASIAIEDIGVRALAKATASDLAERLLEVRRSAAGERF